MWNLYDEAMAKLKERFNTEDEELLIKACVCAIYQDTTQHDKRVLTPKAEWMRDMLTKKINIFLGKITYDNLK